MYQCKCKKVFDCMAQYKHHLKNKKGCGNDILLIRHHCDICQMDFVDKYSLARHQRNVKSKCNENKLIIPNGILNCGFEYIGHFNKERILTLLDTNTFSTFWSILLKDVYFNEELPCNHNWYVDYIDDISVSVSVNDNIACHQPLLNTIIDKHNNLMKLLNPIFCEIQEDKNKNLLSKKQTQCLFTVVAMSDMNEDIQKKYIYQKIIDIAYENRIMIMSTLKKYNIKSVYIL